MIAWVRALTLKGVYIEALILPDKAHLLHLIFKETSLSIIGGDDLVFFSLFLELGCNL